MNLFHQLVSGIELLTFVINYMSVFKQSVLDHRAFLLQKISMVKWNQTKIHEQDKSCSYFGSMSQRKLFKIAVKNEQKLQVSKKSIKYKWTKDKSREP
jgi:hypothetical protein